MSITLDGSNVNTIGLINSATAKTATGTAVDFTGIPSGAKRVTVMFEGVSTNGYSQVIIQVGNGALITSGYVGSGDTISSSGAYIITATSNGFAIESSSGLTSASTRFGSATLVKHGAVWVFQSRSFTNNNNYSAFGCGAVTVSGNLDRIRMTTVNGTDTFDNGSINIMYE